MDASPPTTSEPPTVESATADPLERLLTASFRNRPEAKTIPNLAQRAIERARALDRVAEQQRRSLAIHRWRLWIVYGAAGTLIGVLVLLGGQRLLKEQQAISSGSDDSISAMTDSNTDSMSGSTSLGTSTYSPWLGGLLFICTLAGLAAEGAMAPGRRSLV